MTVQINTHYAASAYRSNNPEPLPPPKWREDANRTRMFDTHIAFGHYANLEPEMEVTAQLGGEEQNIYQRQQEEGEQEEIYCDAARWRFQNSSKIPYILFTLKLMLMAFTPFTWGSGILLDALPDTSRPDVDKFLVFLGCGIIVAIAIIILALFMSGKILAHKIQIGMLCISIGIVLWKQGSLWGSAEMHIALWLGIFLYFMAAIGLDCLLWLHSKVSTHDGSEFNRTDGMLRFKRRFRRLFVAPFEEFDPVLQLLPSGYGAHDYALWLHHRYTDNKVCLATKVHALGLDRANALAFWDCLQRYMDVTQPLPDLPVLEQSRHLDPVTAAHDARTGRNPRRWRDQSKRGWRAGGQKQLAEQLQQHPWQTHPCIIKARIDPKLSIETYYRALEARGIQVTPKGDDFDNLHRG